MDIKQIQPKVSPGTDPAGLMANYPLNSCRTL